MITEGRIGLREGVCLTTITIISKVFYTSPTAVVQIVGTAGWYMTIISAAAAGAAFTLVYLLLRKFPGKNLIEIYENVLGRYIGFIFSFILVISLMFAAVSNITEFTYVLQTFALPMSPPQFIIGLLIAGVMVIGFLGLESLGRVSGLFAYMLIIGFIAVIILGFQNYSIHRIFPIMGYGLDRTVYNGLLRSSAYADVMILAVIAPSMQGAHNIKKAGYLSLVISGAIISVSLLAYSLTFPYYVGQELTAPMYVMVSLIDYGRFFQRLESIFLFIWYLSSFIGIAALFYSAFMVYCQMFRIQDKRPVVIPFSLVLYASSLLPSSIVTIIKVLVPIYREYAWIIFYIPPIIALIISKLMKKGVKIKDA